MFLDNSQKHWLKQPFFAHFTARFSYSIRAALCALPLLSHVAFAEDADGSADRLDETLYQIEFILFKHVDADRSQLEYETIQTPYSQPAQLQHLYPYAQYAPSPTQLAPIPVSATSELASAQARLERSPETEVLLSGQWQQMLAKDSSTLPVMLSDYKPRARTFYGQAVPDRGAQTNTDSTEAKFEIPLTEERYQGHLQINRSRYNHATIWLEYGFHQPFKHANLLDWFMENDITRIDINALLSPISQDSDHNNDVSWVPVSKFEFKQSRRLKDGEVHYLDHPYLGLIVTVSRVKLDQPAPE